MHLTADGGQQVAWVARTFHHDGHWVGGFSSQGKIGLGNNGLTDAPLLRVANHADYRHRKRSADLEDLTHRILFRPERTCHGLIDHRLQSEVLGRHPLPGLPHGFEFTPGVQRVLEVLRTKVTAPEKRNAKGAEVVGSNIVPLYEGILDERHSPGRGQ